MKNKKRKNKKSIHYYTTLLLSTGWLRQNCHQWLNWIYVKILRPKWRSSSFSLSYFLCLSAWNEYYNVINIALNNLCYVYLRRRNSCSVSLSRRYNDAFSGGSGSVDRMLSFRMRSYAMKEIVENNKTPRNTKLAKFKKRSRNQPCWACWTVLWWWAGAGQKTTSRRRRRWERRLGMGGNWERRAASGSWPAALGPHGVPNTLHW